MRFGLDDYHRAQRVSRWVCMAPFIALTVLTVAVTVTSVAHARWYQAGVSALLAVAFTLVATGVNRWISWQADRPNWARNLSPEEFADPALRLQTWRRSKRAKVQAWVMTVIGLASVVVGVSARRADLLIVGAVVVTCGLRVMQQIHRSAGAADSTQSPS